MPICMLYYADMNRLDMNDTICHCLYVWQQRLQLWYPRSRGSVGSHIPTAGARPSRSGRDASCRSAANSTHTSGASPAASRAGCRPAAPRTDTSAFPGARTRREKRSRESRAHALAPPRSPATSSARAACGGLLCAGGAPSTPFRRRPPSCTRVALDGAQEVEGGASPTELGRSTASKSRQKSHCARVVAHARSSDAAYGRVE